MRLRTRRTRRTRRLSAVPLIGMIVFAAASAPAAPEAAPGVGRAAVVREDAPSLPGVLERVRVAAAGEAWHRGGWTDALIDKWIEQTLAAIAEARPELDLPAPGKLSAYAPRDPAELRPGPPGAGGGDKALVVAKHAEIPHASDAVILVDGDAEVAFATNCVIIARGAVYVAHGGGNVIAAGQFIHVSHDGNERRMAGMMAQRGRPAPAAARPAPAVSVLLTGGTLDVSHAMESVCAAGVSAEISNPTGCTFVNTPNVKAREAPFVLPGQPAPKNVQLKLDRVRLGEPPEPHPLAADLRLHALARDSVVFWHKDRRYVADKGKPITDEAGAPVAALAGWVVTLTSDDFAVLGNEQQRATIVLRRRAQ